MLLSFTSWCKLMLVLEDSGSGDCLFSAVNANDVKVGGLLCCQVQLNKFPLGKLLV